MNVPYICKYYNVLNATFSEFPVLLISIYQEVGTIYSHHQKTVIVDADAGHFKRKIVAFIGGLDLCMGRYDTPQHPLFRTLETVHKDDIHNPTFVVFFII